MLLSEANLIVPGKWGRITMLCSSPPGQEAGFLSACWVCHRLAFFLSDLTCSPLVCSQFWGSTYRNIWFFLWRRKFWAFCNPSRGSLPKESWEFNLAHREHYTYVPRKMTESAATFQKIKDSNGNIHLWDCLWQIAHVFFLPVCLYLSRKGWVV